MLDCEPPEMEEPSEQDNGGVSPPEHEVTVLARERGAGLGREKTPCERTARSQLAGLKLTDTNTYVKPTNPPLE